MEVEKLTALKYTHFQSEKLQWYESRFFFGTGRPDIFKSPQPSANHKNSFSRYFNNYIKFFK